MSTVQFEIIKYNAMCWKVYLGNSFLGAHNTEIQAANFVKTLEANIRKLAEASQQELAEKEKPL